MEVDQYVCNFCASTFTTMDDIKFHVFTNHIENQTIKIKQEPLEKVTNSDNLERIDNTEKSLVNYTEKSEKNQTTGSIQNRIGPVACTYCELWYRNEPDFLKHIKNEHGDLTRCKFCKRTFSSRKKNVSHMKLSCAYNPKSYRKENTLQLENGRIQCPECPGAFESWIYVQKHIVRTHILIPEKCHKCLKEFKSQESVKNHIRRGHCAAVPELHLKEICEFCDDEFVNNGSLRKHLRTCRLRIIQ